MGQLTKVGGDSEHDPGCVTTVFLWASSPPPQIMLTSRVRGPLQEPKSWDSYFLIAFVGLWECKREQWCVSSRGVDRGGGSLSNTIGYLLWGGLWLENSLQRTRGGKEKNGDCSDGACMTWYCLCLTLGVPKATWRELCGMCVSVCPCVSGVLQNGCGWSQRNTVLCPLLSWSCCYSHVCMGWEIWVVWVLLHLSQIALTSFLIFSV